MTQYISTKTKNVLVARQGAFHFRVTYYLGLVDEESNALYDHPEDSFAKAIGLPTAVERGLIIAVENEDMEQLVWNHDMVYSDPTLGYNFP
jgi:hypothetical protein